MAEPRELQESVQSRPAPQEGTPITDQLTGWLAVMANADEAPPYWSRGRDQWLRKFVKAPGNDILAGTVATVAGKVATTGWYLEGPERTANLYRRILIQRSDFGAGWAVLVQKLVEDYLTQDAGGWIERIRLGDPSASAAQQGAAIGFAALDNAQMYVLGNPEYPAEYVTSFEAEDKEKEDAQLMHRSQVIHLVDNPSPQEQRLGVGFCSVSRALTTAHILMDIARYERERLSDLPPAGFLLLNNMAKDQWGDLQAQYDTRQEQRGNTVWRQVMVAFGLDPAIPLSAELFSFSGLPEHYDKRTTTEIAVYSFALAFRVDPREIWPVSAGTLGTATEAHIQHLKARAKGTGLLLTEIERAMNDGLSLPASLVFKFDYQDVEEDEQEWRIANQKAEYITKLTKPDQAMGVGILDREEARSWLVREGMFEEEELLTIEDEGRATDTEAAKAKARIDLGPKVRAYSTGRTVHMQRRLWRGWGRGNVLAPALKAATENYQDGTIDAGQLAEYTLAVALEAQLAG